MNDCRFVIAQFCDDIRQEVGNKFSLMGCYGDDLIVDQFPVILPKFAAQIRAATSIDQPFAKLVVRAFLNDELLAEIEIPQEQLTAVQEKARQDSLRISVIAMMAFAPLPIQGPCRLRTEAETESEVLRGSFLNIRDRKAERSPTDPTATEKT